ncbi:unannotated protein [freshwater metagenome]|uniref:Unannotated protein n=1 Tax=freshwater metagenome TaxID=449393 RepID=A0A6J7EJC8_9ZZZZ
MNVYHRAGTGRPIRVLWTLEEIGVPYELTVLTAEEMQQEDYLRIQPLGRAPGFVGDDGPLFESSAICLHLAEAYPDAGLLPAAGTYERAQVYQWVFFAMTEIEPPMLEIWHHREAAPQIVDGLLERAQAAVDVLESAIGGREFLVGDRLSVADIIAARVAGFIPAVGAGELGPNVQAYIERHAQRPAIQRALAKVA